jgi:hypothetical protein
MLRLNPLKKCKTGNNKVIARKLLHTTIRVKSSIFLSLFRMITFL